MLIARLIADTDKLETSLEKAGPALAAAGMSEGTLAGSKPINSDKSAMQIRVPNGDLATLRGIVEEHFAPDGALMASVSFEPVRLLVSDMDSTMIEQECIDELADFAGLKEKVSAITERAMQGELDFETALRERVGLLAGLPESTIAECLEKRITLMPGAHTLVQTLKAMGCRTVLVTGGFHHFADPIANQLGFDHVVGNRLGVADGKLTGELDGPVVDSGTKLSVLQEESAKLPSVKTIATGDGANDIPMLEAADYGIAYKAKPKARAAASGWVDNGDLTAILTMLDVPQEKWAD